MRIVIDLSNLAYICFYALHYTNDSSTQYSKEDFIETCHYKIRSIQFATQATETVFAKDNIPMRKILDENYKGNRHHIVFPIKEDLIEDLLSRNVKIYEAENKEADDVMATLLNEKRVDCIVTSDQDLLQAITDGKQLFNPISMTFWNQDKLKDKFHGLEEYKNILYYKSFFGDNSDNIPKVGDRLPRKQIVEKINHNPSINRLVKVLMTEKYYDKLDLDRLRLNYEMIKLDNTCAVNLLSKS